jgi:hypothetical protein
MRASYHTTFHRRTSAFHVKPRHRSPASRVLDAAHRKGESDREEFVMANNNQGNRDKDRSDRGNNKQGGFQGAGGGQDRGKDRDEGGLKNRGGAKQSDMNPR